MSSGFGNTPKDSTNIPLGSVAVPGTSNGDLTALQGGPASSDSNSNSSAPVSTYVYSGNFVDFGQTTSSAATTDTGTFTFMSFVKRMLQKLTSLVTNTSAFVDSATTGATLQTIGDTASLANSGAQGTWQIAIIPTSTFAGTILFEGLALDGTTWEPTSGHLAGSSLIATSTAFTGSGNVTQVWRGNSSTYKQIRGRLSAVSASTATVYVGLSASPYAMSITNQVQATVTNANTNGQATMTNSAPVVLASDHSKIPIKAASGDFPTGSITDLTTIITNTNKIPASPAQEGGNLATIATIVSSSKAAIKAAANDIVDLATIAGAIVSSVMQINLKQYNGAAVGASNPQFTDGAAQQGVIAVSGTFPLTATTDNSITFASKVRTVLLHNQSAVNVPYEHDQTASAISPYLAPGQMIVVDIHTTVIHVFPPNALPVNAASGLIVRGWN